MIILNYCRLGGKFDFDDEKFKIAKQIEIENFEMRNGYELKPLLLNGLLISMVVQ